MSKEASNTNRSATVKRPAASSPAPRRPATVKAFNAHTLEALKKSNQSEVVRRLIATVEQAWSELADKTPPAQETTEREVSEAEAAFDGKEKVLVVIEATGLIEVYADKWILVKVLDLKPWDDADVEKNKLGVRWLGPWWESKLATRNIVKPSMTLDEQLDWYTRVNAFEKLKEYEAAGKLPELLAMVKQ